MRNPCASMPASTPSWCEMNSHGDNSGLSSQWLSRLTSSTTPDRLLPRQTSSIWTTPPLNLSTRRPHLRLGLFINSCKRFILFFYLFFKKFSFSFLSSLSIRTDPLRVVCQPELFYRVMRLLSASGDNFSDQTRGYIANIKSFFISVK